MKIAFPSKEYMPQCNTKSEAPVIDRLRYIFNSRCNKDTMHKNIDGLFIEYEAILIIVKAAGNLDVAKKNLTAFFTNKLPTTTINHNINELLKLFTNKNPQYFGGQNITYQATKYFNYIHLLLHRLARRLSENYEKSFFTTKYNSKLCNMQIEYCSQILNILKESSATSIFKTSYLGDWPYMLSSIDIAIEDDATDIDIWNYGTNVLNKHYNQGSINHGFDLNLDYNYKEMSISEQLKSLSNIRVENLTSSFSQHFLNNIVSHLYLKIDKLASITSDIKPFLDIINVFVRTPGADRFYNYYLFNAVTIVGNSHEISTHLSLCKNVLENKTINILQNCSNTLEIDDCNTTSNKFKKSLMIFMFKTLRIGNAIAVDNIKAVLNDCIKNCHDRCYLSDAPKILIQQLDYNDIANHNKDNCPSLIIDIRMFMLAESLTIFKDTKDIQVEKGLNKIAKNFILDLTILLNNLGVLSESLDANDVKNNKYYPDIEDNLCRVLKEIVPYVEKNDDMYKPLITLAERINELTEIQNNRIIEQLLIFYTEVFNDKDCTNFATIAKELNNDL